MLPKRSFEYDKNQALTYNVKLLLMIMNMSTDDHRHPSAPSNQDQSVSVILPTFNRRAFLQQAIESVLAQTCPADDFIIVDDGSTDGTAELLSDYADRLRVIRQPNQGVSAARNTGIRSAKGELIALLDSDDYWLPEKLAAQKAFFETHPAAMICQTEETWIRGGRQVNPKKRHKKFSGMIFEKTLPLCLVSPSAVMIRKALFDEVGLFDESLPACEDYDLWLRISWKYPVHLIDTPLIVKRGGHDDQLSAMPELDKYRIKALMKILNQGVLSPAQHRSAMAMLRRKCTIYANGCRKRGRQQEAEDYLNLPNSIDPGRQETMEDED